MSLLSRVLGFRVKGRSLGANLYRVWGLGLRALGFGFRGRVS